MQIHWIIEQSLENQIIKWSKQSFCQMVCELWDAGLLTLLQMLLSISILVMCKTSAQHNQWNLAFDICLKVNHVSWWIYHKTYKANGIFPDKWLETHRFHWDRPKKPKSHYWPKHWREEEEGGQIEKKLFFCRLACTKPRKLCCTNLVPKPTIIAS